MSMRRIAALQAGLLLAATFASAASRDNTIRITVLDSETQAGKIENNGVPTNCDDQITFDAYCRSTRNVPLVSTLLVQQGNAPPFRISCTIQSKFSRCTPLPKGATFDARREKHGITVYYVDDKGKARKEFYTVVDPSGKPVQAASMVATNPVAAVPVAAPQAPQPRVASAMSNNVPSGAARSIPPSAVAAPQAAAAPGPGWVQTVNPEKIRCNFTSTPSGAEISVDGTYAGNTPSEIGLITGSHVIVLSMPGFAEWKRELWVAPDSALNVTANLQKTER